MPAWPYRATDKVFSDYFGWVVIVVVIVPIAAFSVLLRKHSITLEDANTYVDSVVKILVAGVGAAWALNRYFISRVDAQQVRIDAQVRLVPQTDDDGTASPKALLPYYIEITNTGKTKLDNYTLEVELAQIALDRATMKTSATVLGVVNKHDGTLIEPGSWSAVNDVLVVPADVELVRVLVDIKPKSGSGTAWQRHHTYDLSKAVPALVAQRSTSRDGPTHST